MPLTKMTTSVNNIQGLQDRPNEAGMTSSELKETFDKAGSDLKDYLNTVLTEEVDSAIATINSAIATAESKILTYKQIYPVGAIYLSISPTNPGTLFPGTTWTQLKNSFLFATNATSGNKGTITGTGTNTGEASGNTGSTTLTASQLPKITGKTNANLVGHQSYDTSSGALGWDYMGKSGSLGGSNTISYGQVSLSFGGGQGHTHTLNSHTHTIPRLEVYVWKRTA